MNFLLVWDANLTKPFVVEDITVSHPDHGLALRPRSMARIKEYDHATLVWLGDLVLPEGYLSEDQYLQFISRRFNPGEILKAGGHFYCFFHDKKRDILYILTGFSGILPVYYAQASGRTYVASNVESISHAAGIVPTISRRFVLEKLIFNYPLFHHTILEEIGLLPAHHFIQLSDRMDVRRYFDVESLIHPDPMSSKRSLSMLSRFFQQRLERYWPDEKWALSFTGGFDGRALLASALNRELDFTAYAFGASQSPDLTLPRDQARTLDIPFLPIYLEDPEYLDHSRQLGFHFVEQSGGMADMARAHYVYAARLLASKHRYLLTGNFGSELFRAMHLTGEMIALPVFQLFSGKDPELVLQEAMNAPEYQCLNQEVFREDLRDLIQDLFHYKFLDGTKESTNQRFYSFVLEEVFRKYFGPEITMQYQYLINRTPFLDFQFVKNLFSSQLAGVYGDFYTHNPVKRKKGQLWYATLIKDMHKPLYRMKTGKGYAPRDVLTLNGNLFLAWNVLRKKLGRKGQADDSFLVRHAFDRNVRELGTVAFDEGLFNPFYLNGLMEYPSGKGHNALLKTVSLNWYVHKIRKEWKAVSTDSSY